MTAEVSLLESRLRERQLAVAARHYRQAVDSFTDGRLEASNGQLRSCLENTLIELCSRHGKRTSDPKGAAELDLALARVQTRSQFGRAIGSF